MTLATELAKINQRIEYILCIEGIGWPVDESSITAFNGTVFVTNDIAGTLAATLGCTIKKNLQVPKSLTESFNPITLEYSVGGLDFALVDHSDWLLTNFKPHATGNEGALDSSLDYKSTTVVLTDGTNFANGDYLWIAGREAVILYNKSGTTPATYTSCIRGALGTQQGKVDKFIDKINTAYSLTVDMSWIAGTPCYSHNRYWFDRRVLLFAHVPGEAIANLVRLFSGRLRGGPVIDYAGTEWRFSSTGEANNCLTRYYISPTQWKVTFSDFLFPDSYDLSSSTAPGYFQQNAQRRLHISPDPIFSGSAIDYYAMRSLYHYRTEAGGTAGMAAASNTAPQARQVGSVDYIMDRYIKIGDVLLKCLWKDNSSGNDNYNQIITEMDSGAPIDPTNKYDWKNITTGPDAAPVKFLLDNVSDSYERSRFAINREVKRNPIDVLLMFLTSMNNEFYRVDTANPAGSTTVLNFASAGATDMWIGYALFGVEDSNKDYCRLISDNDTTTITVDRAFLSNPTAAKEYQIRNSLYDVLPLGWGCGIHNKKIDIESFENIRDKYLGGATLGKFIIGDGDRYDILDLVFKNICQPYNIFMYISRATGKLTAKWVGEAFGDGVIEDYVAVSANRILELGDIHYNVDQPLGCINIITRAVDNVICKINYEPKIYYDTPDYKLVGGGYYQKIKEDIANPLEGSTVKQPITSHEIAQSYADDNVNQIEISAIFNSVQDFDIIASLANAKICRYATPPPTIEIMLDFSLIQSVQPGVILSVTLPSIPVDPYNQTRGWTNKALRVLSCNIVLDSQQYGIKCNCEILATITGARIAPACEIDIDAAGGGIVDSGADHYFEVEQFSFSIDRSIQDMEFFSVDDKIELRNTAGVVQKTGLTIKTLDTVNYRVYVNENIGVADPGEVGWYITFSDYDYSTNTTHMQNYSAYADTTGNLANDSTTKFYG